MTFTHNYVTAAPEIFLAIASMVLLMIGVFRGDGSTRLLSYLAVLAFAVTLAIVWQAESASAVSFAGMYISDRFTSFAKVLVLIASGAGLIMSQGYIKEEGMNRFEYPVLFVLATLGMLMMISANDLIALYMGIELQSLALYVIAAFNRDSLRSTEAGLKYFVLGALSSGMLLYGCSLIYGFTGSTGFAEIAAALKGVEKGSVGLIVGIVFLCAGLAFKVSAVPFHMWTPDVYEGAPTPVTAFFAVAPKVAALALFMRALIVPFIAVSADWQQIVVFISILSMLLGAFAATFSTAFNYFDGWPRIVGACSRNLFRGTAELSGIGREDLTPAHRGTWYSEYNIYRATMLYSLVASVAFVAVLERPVFLVLVASALAAFVAPVIFFLNFYYCLVIIPKQDRAFYPSMFARWFGWISLVVFTGMTLVLIYWRIWVRYFVE